MSTRSRDPPPPITAHLAAEGAGRVLAAAAAADAGYRLALVDVHTLARVHVLQETLDTASWCFISRVRVLARASNEGSQRS